MANSCMKKSDVLAAGLLLLALAPFCLIAQTTFQRSFSAGGMNGGLFVQNTADGGYIATGQHESSGAGSCDIYLFKRDACGNREWFKTYGGPDSEGGMCVQQMPDGGYITVGLARSHSTGDYDCFLLRTDGLGNQIWLQSYGGAGDDRGIYVDLTSDGGFIVGGKTPSFGNGGNDMYMFKTDALGNMLWSYTYGGPGDDWASYVEEMPDGGFVLVGTTNSFGSGSNDLYVVRTDINGAVIWSKTVGGGAEEGFNEWSVSGHVTSDNGILIASSTKSYGAGGADVFVAKLDFSGNLLWSKAYGGTGNEESRYIREISDGGIIIGGFSNSFTFETLIST